MSSIKFVKKIKSIVAVTSCSSLIFSGFCYFKNDEKFFENFAMPLTRLFAAGKCFIDRSEATVNKIIALFCS